MKHNNTVTIIISMASILLLTLVLYVLLKNQPGIYLFLCFVGGFAIGHYYTGPRLK